MPKSDRLLGRWLHIFEEDQDEIQIYKRLESAEVVPSRRPRDIIEFTKDGKLLKYSSAIDDRLSVSEEFQVNEDGTYTSRLDNKGDVLEVTDEPPDSIKLTSSRR